MEEYLTTNELSRRIKMAPGTIRNLVWKKVFVKNVHYVKPTPKKLLFVWNEVEQWLYGMYGRRSAESMHLSPGKNLIQI